MKGTVIVEYSGKLPEVFLQTIKEVNQAAEIVKTKQLVVKHDYDVDGLLNLIVGLLELTNVNVTGIEIRRDVPDVSSVLPRPMFPPGLLPGYRMAAGYY